MYCGVYNTCICKIYDKKEREKEQKGEIEIFFKGPSTMHEVVDYHVQEDSDNLESTYYIYIIKYMNYILAAIKITKIYT